LLSRNLDAAGDDSDTRRVKTTTPVRKDFSRRIEQPGEVLADEQTPIYARISGYVDRVLHDIGQKVEKGDVLAELSVPEMDEELKQKGALVSQAKSEVILANKLLEVARSDVTSATAKVKEAESSKLRAAAELSRAESQYERFKKSTTVIPQEVLEESRLGFESAKAAVSEVDSRIKSAEAAELGAKARREKAEADIKVAEAKQRLAEADEGRVKALVGYAKLRAPFPGMVTRRQVDTGHFLQPPSGGAEGKPAFVVARLDPVRVFVEVPENDAVLISDGTQATITVPALKGEEFHEAVTRFAWALDAKSRTLRVEIDLKNPGWRLRPGMYVQSVLTVERKQVLAIPQSAIVTQGDDSFCFIVVGGRAVRTPIILGLRDSDFVEVLKKRTPGKEGKWLDFTGKEEVVTSNSSDLRDGQQVDR
jgi:RND family efflux transporter MFP subunit